MVFTVVAAAAVVPPVVTAISGVTRAAIVDVGVGMVLAVFALLVLTPLTTRLLTRRGPGLISAVRAGDTTRLRKT